MNALLTPAEMSEADRLAVAAGTSEPTLMERAGRAVADAACRRALGTRILVLCGLGNNGGDGFVAARVLVERGYPVRLALMGERAGMTGSAAAAAQRWMGAIEPADSVSLDRVDLVVDALLGAGLARDVVGPMKDLIERIAARPLDVIAVDLPSGIDGETGRVRGAAISARETVTFFRRKPGHVLLPGRQFCGTVRIADIGIEPAILDVIRPKTFVNAPALWIEQFPRLAIDGHKYARGHALVVSGGPQATGAARLAARAALRIGAGLVTVASPSSALTINAVALEAVMVRRSNGAEGLRHLLADRRRNAVVAGPGLEPDEATRAIVDVALASDRGVVLDAGALAAFAGRSQSLFDKSRGRHLPAILTPHEGEFARLFGETAGASKLERARVAASRAGAIVVLKGPDTVIASPDGRAAICENAPPTLGTAGSGDVLSGMVAGLLAQGMPPFEAAAAAAWMHGEAAQAHGRGLIAEDLPGLIPKVLDQIDAIIAAPKAQG